ncbi:MAG: hypothetical protein Q7Q73_19410 [Verrucomicrobiota bacterium JB024]|nr:hypothetical protein [Verrucomicrobiota bacterium JB024]
MSPRAFILPLVTLGCLLAPLSASAIEIYRMETQPGSGITAEMTRAFDKLPERGYYPLRLTIVNTTNADKTWTVRSSRECNGWYGGHVEVKTEWQQELSVPAGQRRSFELLSPVIDSAGYTSGCQVEVSGPGTAGSFWVDSLAGRHSSRTQLYGIASDTLRLKYGSRLEDYLQRNDCELISGTCELGFFPQDWRGYTGVDILWFQQSDWEKATPEKLRPILQWVAQGGDLRILKDKGTPDSAPVSGLPGEGHGLIAHGAGVVRVYPFLSEEELFQFPSKVALQEGGEAHYSDEILELYNALGANFWMRPASLNGDLARMRPASDAFLPKTDIPQVAVSEFYQPKGVNFPLVTLSVLAFGIVVGPVNLWVFARGRKRYRLLFTTPLISVAFCVLISVFILVADGVGGEGQVARLFILPEGSNQEVLIEEQFARTGLLLGREFEPGEGVWPVPLGSQATGGRDLLLDGTYGFNEATCWGAWFGSRRVQGVALTQIRPTRAGFDIQLRDGELAVVSSFPGTCPELYLTTDEGTIYRARDVTTGKPAPLEPVSRQEFERWLGDVLNYFSESTMETLNPMDIQPDHIYASVEHYTGDSPQTVSGIDWQPYTGLVIAAAKTAPTATEEARP